MTPDPLTEWRSKLAYLQVALAQCSDPAQKFTLEAQIREAEGWVAKLGEAGEDPGARGVDFPRSPPPPPRWRSPWVLVALGLLLAALAIGLWLRPDPQPLQAVAGLVRDPAGEPLPGVLVALPTYGVYALSDALGAFHLEVRGPYQASADLQATKDGFRVSDQFAVLGDTGVGIRMQRRD